MTFNEAQAEFAVRYYRWAREEFRSEVEHRFPLLTKLNTRTSKACLHLMGRMAVNDQLNFAAALVKRFHMQAVQIAGENLSSEETDLVRCYTDSILVTAQDQGVLWGQPQRGGTALRVSRKNLTAIVKHCLGSVLKQKPEERGGGNWRYSNPIGGLQVYTHLDFGGRFHKLCYSHDIVFSGHNLLIQFASVEAWLGLSSQTLWSHLDESNAERTAQLVAELCARFLDAAPGLVSGISP